MQRRPISPPRGSRPGVSVETRVLVRQIVFDGSRAVGVEIVQGGRTETIRAEREVIVSAGAIKSPQLLMLSGIGPGDHLREAGVTPHHDLPGVGANLQDHLEIYIQHACLEPVTLYAAQALHRKAMIGAQWLLTRTGSAPPPTSSPAASSGRAPASSIRTFSTTSYRSR